MRFLVLLRPRVLKIALIVVPFIGMSLYLAFIASDRYVSEAVIGVRQASADASSLPGAAILLAGVNPPARQDTLFAQKYIHSLVLLRKLDAEFKLRQHYNSPKLDLPFRLPADATQEDFLEYFRNRTEVSLDDVSGLLTVRVQAFNPDFAQRLAQRVLAECETFVNESSQHIAAEQLRFAEGEVKTAGARVQAARNELLAFQTKHRLLDPTAQAQTSGMITAELQGSLARRQAELRGLQSYLNDDAPQIKALRAEVQALQSQIDAERARATVSEREGDRLNALAADFQALRLRVDFAIDGYKLALTAMENARIESTRKIKSLVVVEPPSRPETAEYPLRTYNLVTAFVVSLLLYAIVRLTLATIREHQD